MKAVFRMEREKQNFLFYKEYENDSSILGFHSQIELYFVDDGEMEATVNSHHKTLKKGEMCVSLSFDAHSYSTPAYSRSSVLIIPTYMCSEFIESIKDKRIATPFICNPKTVSEIKEYVTKLNLCHDNDVKKHGYICLILGIVAENIYFEKSDISVDTSLSSKMLMYISSNYAKNISLKTVAAELGYNQSYLSRYFKSCFKVGFNQYLTTIRLKNALMLMNEKKHKLTYCALESGFNSLRTFHRAFNNEFKCTPKEYLKK
ncbi:MAG: helix-turn-helix domain-containing protein [Ruminococcaceae bacterium]|nr:helix-turn-helix domain-containing protein [Oscillospiraceae bacterium]